MTARMATKLMATGLTALLAVAIGCGDDEAPGVGEGEEPPEDSRLVHHLDQCDDPHATACSVTVTVGQNLPLAVRLIGPDGNPVEDALVDFEREPVDGAENTSLQAGTDFTDNNGVAETTLRTGDADNPEGYFGSVDVTASVDADEDVEPIEFNVAVGTKDRASYIINFTNEGDSNPDYVQPMLIDPDRADCDEARESFFDDHFWPSAELVLDDATVNPDGSINDAVSPPIGNNNHYTVVGVAVEEIGDQEVDVAYGCVQGPTIQDGSPQEFEVPINDHIPHLGDRYETFNSFSLTDALPGPIATIIDLLHTLATAPEKFIISDKDDDVTSLLDDIIVNALPDNALKDNIEAVIDNQLARAAIQDFLSTYIEEMVPQSIQDAGDVVGDITGALKSFNVHGNFYFYEQPDPAGEIKAEHTLHRWDTIIFEWSLGCDSSEPGYEECKQVPIGTDELGSIQDDIVDGHFDGQVVSTNAIEIEQHALTLHYGALMLSAFERLVLPRIFGENEDGQSINSLDRFFDDIVNCTDLGVAVGDEEGSALAEAAESMCDELTGQATDAVYDYVTTELTAGGDDHFELQTAPGTRCSMQQPEVYTGSDWPGYPLPYVETFGLGDDSDSMGCEWEVEIDYTGSGSPNHTIGGTFEGELAD